MAATSGLARLWRGLRAAPRTRQPSDLVVMIHTGRCGSTVLGDLLNQSPHIRWDSEIFTRSRGLDIPADENGSIRWREFIRERRVRSDRRIVGIEIKTSQILSRKIFPAPLDSALRAIADLADFPIVFLHRRNHIERMLSGLRAARTSVYSYRSGQERPPDVAVSFPRRVTDRAYAVRDCEAGEWLRRAEEQQALFMECVEAVGGRTASYETHVATDPVRGCQEILSGFGIPAHAPHLRYSKIDARPMHDRIENFDELRRCLTPDQAERYLD